MASTPATQPPPLPLGTGEVHLALADVALLDDAGLASRYRGLLAPEELDRLAAFQVEGARRQYLLTRALVRCALSRHRAVEPAAWRFTVGPHGRPEVAGGAGPRFNASNAAGLVACAVTGELAVGVDVEPHESGPAVARLGARVFSTAEQAAIAALPPEGGADLALSLWTLKEAYAKALGLGLSLEPGAITFSVGAGGIALVRGAGDDGPWDFRLLEVAGHRLALALALGGAPARVILWRAVPLVGFEPLEAEGRPRPPGPSGRGPYLFP